MTTATADRPTANSGGIVALFVSAGVITGALWVFNPVAAVAMIATGIGIYVAAMDAKAGVALLALVLPFQRLLATEILGYSLKPSHVMALILIGAVVYRALKIRSWRIFWTPMDVPYALFLLAALSSVGIAINVPRSLAILSWAGVSYFIGFTVSRLMADGVGINRTIKSLILSGALVSAFGIYQFIASYAGLPTWLRDVYIGSSAYLTRIHATFLEPLHFASYLIVVIPIALGWTVYCADLKVKPLAWVGLGLMTVALGMTISRGGYIAFAIALLVFYLLGEHKPRRRLTWKAGLVAITVALIVVLVLAVFGVPDIIMETIVGGQAIRAGSSMTRVMLVQDTIRMFVDSPFIGIGIGNFGPYYNMKTFRGSNSVADFRQANNIIFEVLAETGLIGLTLFFLTGIAFAWMLWVAITRARTRQAYGLSVGVAAASAGAAFQFLTYTPIYAEWVWFMVGLAGAQWRGAIAKNDDNT